MIECPHRAWCCPGELLLRLAMIPAVGSEVIALELDPFASRQGECAAKRWDSDVSPLFFEQSPRGTDVFGWRLLAASSPGARLALAALLAKLPVAERSGRHTELAGDPPTRAWQFIAELCRLGTYPVFAVAPGGLSFEAGITSRLVIGRQGWG